MTNPVGGSSNVTQLLVPETSGHNRSDSASSTRSGGSTASSLASATEEALNIKVFDPTGNKSQGSFFKAADRIHGPAISAEAFVKGDVKKRAATKPDASQNAASTAGPASGGNSSAHPLENIAEFMQTYSIIEHQSLIEERPMLDLHNIEPSENPAHQPGVLKFHFTPTKHNASVLLLTPTLNADESKNKDATTQQQPINAYWLPWKPNEATEITLGRDADYFFTNQMAGCRLQVDMNDPRAPKVVHVSGSTWPSGKSTTSDWKDNKAKEKLADGYEGSHRMSISKGDFPDRYNGEGLNIVGRFNRDTDQWEFHAQQIDAMAGKVVKSWQWIPNNGASTN